MELKEIYKILLEEYGPQGWWPIIRYDDVNLSHKKTVSPEKAHEFRGYHPGDYSYPHNDSQRFEIICGAILTQNTNWNNVEKALHNLAAVHLLEDIAIINADIDDVKDAIRPAGYFNQKAERLKIMAEFFMQLNGRIPTRKELLDLKGVGPETADSILLYAYHVPIFVVDSYTRRLLLKLEIIDSYASYDEIQKLFHSNLEEDYKLYQEFHALIVESAKNKFTTLFS